MMVNGKMQWTAWNWSKLPVMNLIEKDCQGDQTPVFFGSALTNFGVQTFLETYLQFAPAPSDLKTGTGMLLSPLIPNFLVFVFKIQANMNPPVTVIELPLSEFVPVNLIGGMDVKHSRLRSKWGYQICDRIYGRYP